jgi:hypothetical protein
MSSPGKLALIALADQEGVLLLHTALMDRESPSPNLCVLLY